MHPERGFLIWSCAGRGPAPNLEASLSLQEDPLRLRPRAASKGRLRGDANERRGNAQHGASKGDADERRGNAQHGASKGDADERRGNAQHGACETEKKWVKRPDAWPGAGPGGGTLTLRASLFAL
jgi:hypothetical protein